MPWCLKTAPDQSGFFVEIAGKVPQIGDFDKHYHTYRVYLSI
ncbi:hypothetical protein FHS68_002950 [Dyadobacter arcticus]|uniref:Uncharacterized protein n=1 Tax=Dyadobacter arcticus TaxID=1078754 RepID=A0ABX0UL95_9BACT|nr:hypothetical protein [Dyadobacter arcticus]